jgi:hypothetical protein
VTLGYGAGVVATTGAGRATSRSVRRWTGCGTASAAHASSSRPSRLHGGHRPRTERNDLEELGVSARVVMLDSRAAGPELVDALVVEVDLGVLAVVVVDSHDEVALTTNIVTRAGKRSGLRRREPQPLCL